MRYQVLLLLTLVGAMSNLIGSEVDASECAQGPKPSQATVTLGTKVTNPLSTSNCPGNQVYVYGNEKGENNSVQFIYTTNTQPNSNNSFPNEVTPDQSYMVRLGIFDKDADQNDATSAYHNRIKQNFNNKVYYSDITVYNAGELPTYKVSLGKTASGESIAQQFSPAGDLLNAYGTYEYMLQTWAPWSGATGAAESPVVESGADGVVVQRYGSPGAGGSAGAVFVPPGDGSAGAQGPTINFNSATENNFPKKINATGKNGLLVSSIGGNGGSGGASYLSWNSGAKGGNGGKGETSRLQQALMQNRLPLKTHCTTEFWAESKR